MNERNDIHSPKSIDPADYIFVGGYATGEKLFYVDESTGRSMPTEVKIMNDATDKRIEEMGAKPFRKENGKGGCDHCGAWFKWGEKYVHKETNEAIYVGHICAEETFSADDRADLEIKRAKKAAANRRKKQKLIDEGVAFAFKEGLFMLSELTEQECAEHHRILGKLWNAVREYGSLTDKQIELAEKLIAGENQKEARDKFAAENDMTWLVEFKPVVFATDAIKAVADREFLDCENQFRQYRDEPEITADEIDRDCERYQGEVCFAAGASDDELNRAEWQLCKNLTTLRDLQQKFIKFGTLSVGQMKFAVSLKAKLEGTEEKGADVVTGKGVTIEGVIASTKSKESQFGTQCKMVVKCDDGSKVWSTIPSQIDDGNTNLQDFVGKRVRFVANVTASDDDSSFGFASRPRKAEFVEGEAA